MLYKMDTMRRRHADEAEKSSKAGSTTQSTAESAPKKVEPAKP